MKGKDTYPKTLTNHLFLFTKLFSAVMFFLAYLLIEKIIVRFCRCYFFNYVKKDNKLEKLLLGITNVFSVID